MALVRRKKSKIRIGVFIDSFLSRNQFDIWLGIVAAISDGKVGLVGFAGGSLEDTSGYFSRSNIIYDLVSKENIDGLIGISGFLGNFTGIQNLASFYRKYSPIPIVSIGAYIDGCTNILVDNRMGMREGITHLIEAHNIKRIAFIKGTYKNPEAEERFGVYKEMLEAYSISLDQNLVVKGDFTEKSSKEAVSVLIDERNATFDAVVAANDFMALEAIKELRRRGIKVPQDVAVIGFDDIEESKYSNPPLTTVRQPLFNLGYQAVSQLITIVNGDEVPSKIELPTRLVIRRSCRCLGTEKRYSYAKKEREESSSILHTDLEGEDILLSLLVQKMEKHLVDLNDAIKSFEWAKQISFFLTNDLNMKTGGKFLSTLEDILVEASERDIDTLCWYPIITALFQKAIKLPSSEKIKVHVDHLWKEALVLIGEIGGRIHASLRLHNVKTGIELQLINQELATTFDIEKLKDILFKYLPGFGIKSCYLSLYEGEKSISEYSRLIFAFRDNKIIFFNPDKARFKSIKLLPSSVNFPKKPGKYIVVPLHFSNTQFGFIIFEFGPTDSMLYRSLAIQISGALEGSNLLTKVEKQTSKFQKEATNNTSDFFNENIKLRQEIKEKLRIQRELDIEKERARVTLKSIGDGVIIVNNNGIITYLNPVAENLTGWKNIEAVGLNIGKVLKITYNFQSKQQNPLTEVFMYENCILELEGSIILTSRDGRVFTIKETISPIQSSENEILGVVFILHNMSEAQMMSQTIVYQSTHDALTGLYNRSKFEGIMNKLLIELEDKGNEHVFGFVDIDKFKMINDTWGSIAGDELLKYISSILKSNLRSTDIIARLGADQFGMIFSSCPLNKAKSITEDICKQIHRSKYQWQEMTCSMTVSIGLISISNTAYDITNILSAATMACSFAKKNGGNRVHVFSKDDKELQKYHSDIYFLPHITRALEEDRFCLYSQIIKPIGKTISTGDHYEVLIRMLDENKQVIAPEVFISAAERYNIMPKLDRWAINKLFSSYKIDYNETVAHTRGKFSINLSGATLSDEKFLDYVFDQFDRYNIPPFMICFEITETVAFSNLKRVLEFMDELKKIGCCFSLDDFGTGWNSFKYLKILPVDYLKIDGSFVRGIAHDALDYVLVEAINEIGHAMGLETIAEYVESPEILVKLKDMGVNYAQGYSIAKPEPFIC